MTIKRTPGPPLPPRERARGREVARPSALNWRDEGRAELRASLAEEVECASIEAIKECVKAGMGLTILPRIAVRRELSDRELIALPWHGSPLAVPTQMLWHKDRWISPPLTAFLNCARNELSLGSNRRD